MPPPPGQYGSTTVTDPYGGSNPSGNAAGDPSPGAYTGASGPGGMYNASNPAPPGYTAAQAPGSSGSASANTNNGLAQFAAATSGVTQAQLQQQKDEFDQEMAFAQQQLQQLGIPQLQISQFLATLQQQQFMSQLAATQAGLTGYYQPYTYTPPAAGQLSGTYTPSGAPVQTEAAKEFAQQQALAAQQQAFQQALAAANINLQQGQLGQQYLSTAASLQGPQNTFQLSNYLRGAQGNPQVPTYLSALANNLGLPSFQATGSTAPTPASAGGLGSQLSGSSSATPGWDYGSTTDTINKIMQSGAQSLAPGSLEKLTPDELSAFGSGLGALGGSLPSFMSAYQASRIGQQSPVSPSTLR